MSNCAITDQLGRKHDYLRISLTERCNLRCFYCMPEEGIPLRDKSAFMRQEEILAIAKKFTELGIEKIRLTGGEPLIRKDAAEIIRGLGKLPVELAITTNGILIHKFIDVLKENRITTINVSLDSLNKEKQCMISRGNFFDRIMSNIHMMVAQGFKVKVNMVVMKKINDDEIVDFVLWTKRYPIHVRFIEFMPFDGNKWHWDKKVSYKEIVDKIKKHFPQRIITPLSAKPHDTAKNFKMEGHMGSFGIISPVTNPFCDTCNRIRLTADGKIKNCLFSKDETDLLNAYREGRDLAPVIRETIWKKEAARGGIHSFENVNILHKNRSMVSIGG